MSRCGPIRPFHIHASRATIQPQTSSSIDVPFAFPSAVPFVVRPVCVLKVGSRTALIEREGAFQYNIQARPTHTDLEFILEVSSRLLVQAALRHLRSGASSYISRSAHNESACIFKEAFGNVILFMLGVLAVTDDDNSKYALVSIDKMLKGTVHQRSSRRQSSSSLVKFRCDERRHELR